MNGFKYDKTYEIYALLSMEQVQKHFTDGFSKGERPDWVNDNRNIGFEVVRAENEHLGYTKHFVNKYLGKMTNIIRAQDWENFKGETYIENGRLVAVSDSKELVDGTRHIELAIQKLEKKMTMLKKSGFRILSNNFLYIFLTNTVIESDAELFYDKYRQLLLACSPSFNCVFLFDNNAIYSRSVDGVSKHVISNENLATLKQQAQQLRNASLWKNNTVFEEIKRQCDIP